MYSIIPFFGCRYKSTLSGLMFLFCKPTIKKRIFLRNDGGDSDGGDKDGGGDDDGGDDCGGGDDGGGV